MGLTADLLANVPRTARGSLPEGNYYRTHGGERLDQVALSVYGSQDGVVEALLIYNPRLGDQPFILPANLAIELPELLQTGTDKANAREVALWG